MFSIMPKRREILVGNQMERFDLTGKFPEEKGQPLKEVHFDQSDQSV